MKFIQQPLYILTVLLALVIFSEWLATKKYFRHIGSVLIVILAAAILANCGLIPSSGNAPPLYNGIFEYAAPLGIFFLLLDVRIRDLKLAGLPMLTMFLLGSVTTIAGVVTGYYIFSPQHHHINYAPAVAGMYTGTYIGGSANLNAIALHYGVVKDGTLFAAVNAVDNILSTVWIMLTLVLPRLLQRIFPRKKRMPSKTEGVNMAGQGTGSLNQPATLNLMDLSILLGMGLGTLFISQLISEYIPQVPSILTLTTIALILAQLPFVHRLKGGKILGYLLILIFLAVVGAFCDIQALINSGEMAGILLAWVGVIIFIHALLLFTVGGIFRQDWDIVSIASNANIGGATSATVCATSLGRPDLQLPGLLVGSVGNAIGTYLGILVAEFLK